MGRLRYNAEELPLTLPPDGVSQPPMTDAERLVARCRPWAFSAAGHPLELLRERLEALGVLTSQALEELPAGAVVRVAGLVAIGKCPPASRGWSSSPWRTRRG